MKRATLRVFLAPTTNTAIPCIECGRFRVELAIGTSGLVLDAQAGIHRACLRRAREAARAERRDPVAALAARARRELSDVSAPKCINGHPPCGDTGCAACASLEKDANR